MFTDVKHNVGRSSRGRCFKEVDLLFLISPVPRHQRGQFRLKRLNHWGRLPRRITDQLGRHPQIHLAQFVINGLVRDAELGHLRLIGGMHAGWFCRKFSCVDDLGEETRSMILLRYLILRMVIAVPCFSL
jgi:hypothetical protein